MAYSAVLTKQSVSLQGGIYNIVVLCQINEGTEGGVGEVVWEGTGSGRYNPNTGNLDGVKNSILAELQGKWDKWIAEQNIYNSPTFDSAISDMQNTVNGYINS